MIIHKSRSVILASKMFKASPRQKEILAAIDDVANLELVQQLDEYLDDEFITMKYGTDTTTDVDYTDDAIDDIDNAPQDDSAPAFNRPSPSHSSGSPATFTPNDDESLMDKHGDELEDLENNAPELEKSSDEPVDTNSAVKAKSTAKPIVADTIVNPFVDLYASLVGVANEIKGTLNVRQDTAGVSRVQIKNDELWIYYNDDINLNNVMANVIDVLNAANYKYFEFNRLARTDNAIVFTVDVETSKQMQATDNAE